MFAIILLVLQARRPVVKRAWLVFGSFLGCELFLFLNLLSQLFFLLWTHEWSPLRTSWRRELYRWSSLTDHFLRRRLSLSRREEKRPDLVWLTTDLSRPKEKLLQLRCLLVCWVLTLRSGRVVGTSLALLEGAICQPCVEDTLHSVLTVLIHLQ